jgi:NDP-sugar pyrophosphorylase family protein
LAFTGIAVYEPEFLQFLPTGASSVVDAWLKAVNAGYRIGTFNVNGCYWSDIGTPEAYARAVFDALKTEGKRVHPSIGKRMQKY